MIDALKLARVVACFARIERQLDRVEVGLAELNAGMWLPGWMVVANIALTTGAPLRLAVG
jgi:hypothetical protein